MIKHIWYIYSAIVSIYKLLLTQIFVNLYVGYFIIAWCMKNKGKYLIFPYATWPCVLDLS